MTENQQSSCIIRYGWIDALAPKPRLTVESSSNCQILFLFLLLLFFFFCSVGVFTQTLYHLLYIDQYILNESKNRRKNLAMAWIDYKKAYDMVRQSWIINCLKMYKISHEIINFIEKTMKNWRVELTAGGKSLAETKIQRGIFQGDALSPRLFIIAVMPQNHILRKCTAGYKLSRSQEKINHLMYTDDIKLFAKNEKVLETLIHTEYTVKT